MKRENKIESTVNDLDKGAHYFYKLLVKMMEELEFSVTQFNKVVFYDFSKTVPSKFKVRGKGKKRQKNFK